MTSIVRRQISFWNSFPESKITRQFKQFHAENPHVFDELLKLSRDLRSRGFRHYSIKTLFEVVRWHRSLETTGDIFKLNNNYHAYYARLLMRVDEKLDGFFRTRDSKADEM